MIDLAQYRLGPAETMALTLVSRYARTARLQMAFTMQQRFKLGVTSLLEMKVPSCGRIGEQLPVRYRLMRNRVVMFTRFSRTEVLIGNSGEYGGFDYSLLVRQWSTNKTWRRQIPSIQDLGPALISLEKLQLLQRKACDPYTDLLFVTTPIAANPISA